MKKCKTNHGWAYLNKRFDEKELTIVCFCDECGWIDPIALKLQKEIDKANKEYDQYKAPSLHEAFLPRVSKMKN